MFNPFMSFPEAMVLFMFHLKIGAEHPGAPGIASNSSLRPRSFRTRSQKVSVAVSQHFSEVHPMLTRDLLARVRKIEIKTRKVVEEMTGGAYRSVYRGRGIEFSEVRTYTEGDDVRDIDWNVTARTGVAHIKKYVEERELTVIIAVDISSSTLFGSAEDDKRDKMAETAALLAFSAIRNNDKVGLLLFSDRVESYIPPRSGRAHVMRVIRDLVATHPRGRGTNIAAERSPPVCQIEKTPCR